MLLYEYWGGPTVYQHGAFVFVAVEEAPLPTRKIPEWLVVTRVVPTLFCFLVYLERLSVYPLLSVELLG